MKVVGTIDEVWPHLFTPEERAKFASQRLVAALAQTLEENARRARRDADAQYVQALEDRIVRNRSFKTRAMDAEWSTRFKQQFEHLRRYRADTRFGPNERNPWAGRTDDYLAERAGVYADEWMERTFGKTNVWETP